MSPQYRRIVAAAAATVLILLPGLAFAVEARFDLSSPASSPFPSDRFTVDDHDQKTGLRVSLPKPDCAVRVSDCADIDVINTLDGFNLQPRLSIPFSGPIDVSTVSHRTVFLVRLGQGHGHHGDPVGINQIVWDPATNMLHAESDELLDQHTRYLLVVTDGVRDTDGRRVKGEAFEDFLGDGKHKHHHGGGLGDYRGDLREALDKVEIHGHRTVAASVFTTLSATAVLEKIRREIKHSQPKPATVLGTFPLINLNPRSIQWRREVRKFPNPKDPTDPLFVFSTFPVAALGIIPGVGSVAFGSFESPDWELMPEGFIPPIGTRTEVPAVQRTNTLYFNLVIPAGMTPPGGWPVAIFGHGFTDSKQGAPSAVASTFASHGIATIAINVVGHGGGDAGTLIITPNVGTPLTIPDGGRGIDQDGNGTVDSTEGVNALPPRGIIGNRDGLPPTVAINTVPGAMAIQEVLDNTEWVSQSGNPVAYAPHLRKRPLHETDPPPVIIQFAKGDQTVPNPTASAIFRAGDLADRSSYFRNDLVRLAFPTAPANPHTFLTNIGVPAGAGLAIAAQQQIAAFFASD